MTETSREYAEALFEIAIESDNTEKYSEYLSVIKNVTEENPGYLLMLDSPAIPLSERLSAIDTAFGNYLDEYTLSFLKLLCENNRIKELTDCIDWFEELKRAALNRTVANIYSAVELSTSQKSALCKKLEKLSGKSIDAVYTVDKSLLGGIKVEIDGRTLDSSIEKRLQKAKGVMNG